MNKKQLKRIKRHRKIRSTIKGVEDCPRLNVFRSNKNIYIQLINDLTGKTLFSVNGKEIKNIKGKTAIAFAAGKLLAEKSLKKFKKVVFDRGGYKYHGRVKSVADGAREGGLQF